MGERVRVEIGFRGGQTLGVQIPVEDAERFERELSSERGTGAVTLHVDDGELTIVLAHVLYLKRHARESRVGFGV